MTIATHLRYSPNHEWLDTSVPDDFAVGISDHAQETLGDIVFLELPEVGRQVSAGEACAVVESVKAASDIYAPISGEVTAINQEALDSPEKVNQDAYAAWLFKIKPGEKASQELFELFDATAYEQSI